MKKGPLNTVWVFARVNTKRFFRNRTAIFFGLLFPLIFLFVFGGVFGGSNNMSFNVAIINQSTSSIGTNFYATEQKSPVLKIKSDITTLDQANKLMSEGQLDAIIVIPKTFGEKTATSTTPTGSVVISYTQNNQQAAQALASIIQGQLQSINAQYVNVHPPFTVDTKLSNSGGLTPFDYTFAGLLGFAILGSGIFGPVNVFPELKKQGILRRLHTTPLKVWQYFLATAISQTAVALVTMAAMFAAAIFIFHVKILGNYLELIAYLILSIVMVLGIGLAIGGWAKDQSQAAPISNIVVFPMMFLSGTFFPRFLMPDWLQTVSTYFPLTPVIDGLRMIATEGKHIIDILPQFGLVCAWLVVVYLIAFRVFRWT